MDFDKKCKWYKSCGADFCHGEGICPEFEYKQAKPIPKPKYKKRKSEPVIKIQLQDKKECWVCGSTQNLECHHVYEGNGRRAKSEKYGLKVYLCHNHHNENIPGDAGVHHNAVLDGILKRMAQRKFEEVYGRNEFVKIFGRNYL